MCANKMLTFYSSCSRTAYSTGSLEVLNHEQKPGDRLWTTAWLPEGKWEADLHHQARCGIRLGLYSSSLTCLWACRLQWCSWQWFRKMGLGYWPFWYTLSISDPLPTSTTPFPIVFFSPPYAYKKGALSLSFSSCWSFFCTFCIPIFSILVHLRA